MENGKEQMKDLKDSNGNPIGEQLMDSLSGPMSMMKLMSMASGMKPDNNNSDNNNSDNNNSDNNNSDNENTNIAENGR